MTCPFCPAPIARLRKDQSKARPGLCKPCARLRVRIQCLGCGRSITDPNGCRGRCAPCQVKNVEVLRSKRRAERTAWARHNTVPVEVPAQEQGAMREGELLCVDCIKVKPLEAFRRGDRTCRRCRGVAVPKLAMSMAEAEGMG